MNGLIDTHQHANNISKGQCDKMCIRGSKCIDMVAMTHGTLSCARGCKLIEVDEIAQCDHRGCAIDASKNGHLDYEVGSCDNIGRIEINPAKNRHREKIEESLLQHMDKIEIEEKIAYAESNLDEHVANEVKQRKVMRSTYHVQKENNVLWQIDALEGKN